MFAVVGCGCCRNLWVIHTDANEQTTNCTRCGRRYNRDERAHLAEADTRKQAVAERSRILERRAAAT